MSHHVLYGFERLYEFFLVEGLQQLGVVRVDAPVLCQPIQQGLCHVLEVTPHVEVVQGYPVITLEVKVVENEVLG